MMDIYENMENQTKIFVKEQLRDAKNNSENAARFQFIAFGALLFSANHLFPCYNQKLADWWTDEILPQFRELGA